MVQNSVTYFMDGSFNESDSRLNDPVKAFYYIRWETTEDRTTAINTAVIRGVYKDHSCFTGDGSCSNTQFYRADKRNIV